MSARTQNNAGGGDALSDGYGMADVEGLVLPFDFDVQPTRLLNLCGAQGNGVHGGIWLERFGGIGRAHVYEGAAELDGAHDGGVFKGLTGGAEGREEDGKDGAGTGPTTRHGWNGSKEKEFTTCPRRC